MKVVIERPIREENFKAINEIIFHANNLLIGFETYTTLDNLEELLVLKSLNPCYSGLKIGRGASHIWVAQKDDPYSDKRVLLITED